jgi:thiamine biosynthesis lipoprotein
LFQVAGRDWYAFGTGELARVNALLSRGAPAPVSPDLAPLISRAIELHALSGGRFDPGVCALVRLWQFDSVESLATASAPPTAAEVHALRTRQGTLADLRFDGRTVAAARPLCIDLGGMAKGTALERARAVFARHGIGNALLDLGGSSQLALGRNGTRPWYVGLRHPRKNRVFARLAIEPGETTATSGDYENAYVQGGRRYHHVLDPRTGRPTTGTASVTVLARNGELAEAATKALMVGGRAQFGSICAAMGVADALLITTAGELVTTPGMAARLRRDNGQVPVLDWPGAESGDL